MEEEKNENALSEQGYFDVGLPLELNRVSARSPKLDLNKKVIEDDSAALLSKCQSLNSKDYQIWGYLDDKAIKENGQAIFQLNLSGNKNENLELLASLPLVPTLTIEFLNGQFRVLYLVENCSREIAEEIKQELSSEFKVNIPKKILVPGFINPQKKRFLVKLHQRSTAKITLADFIHYFDLGVWPVPNNLNANKLTVMKLDKDMLPKLLSNFVFSAAKSVGCPSDYVAIPLIILIASLIGHKIHIQPTDNEKFIVTVNLWGMLVGEPGTKKTPGSSIALGLLEGLVEAAESDFESKAKRSDTRNKLNSIQLKLALSESKKILQLISESTDEKDKRRLLRKAEKVIQKSIMNSQDNVKKRYKTSNITLAGLHKVLLANPNGLLLYIDEIVGLLSIMGRNGSAELKAYILECFTGFGSYDVDRATSKHQSGRNMSLSIFGTIQPDKLKPYLAKVLNGGEDNDGWFNRFQLTVFPEAIPANEISTEMIDLELYGNLENLVLALDEHDFGFSDELSLTNKTVKFSRDAEAIYKPWLESLGNEFKDGIIHPVMESHLRKYDSLVPSLALIFHVVTAFEPDSSTIRNFSEVGVKATQRAINFASYLRSHANKMFDTETQVTKSNAILISGRLHQLRKPFTTRDITQREWSGLGRDSRLVNEALEYLAEHNWIKKLDGYSTNVKWLINPKNSI